MGKSIWLCIEWLRALSKLSALGECNSVSRVLGSDSPADLGGDLGQVTQQVVSTSQGYCENSVYI